MKHQRVTVNMIFDEVGEPARFLMQNGGGRFSFWDCAPSNQASIDEFLLEVGTAPKPEA